MAIRSTDDESRNLLFKEPIPNQALQGHVIKTEQVLNEGSCRVQCYLEPNCVSINVGPLKDGAHQCELNNATDENQFAAALKKKTAHTYLAIEVGWSFLSQLYFMRVARGYVFDNLYTVELLYSGHFGAE